MQDLTCLNSLQSPIPTKLIARTFARAINLVGVARLELAALRSRTVRATKLRYTPKILNFCKTLAHLGARCACPLGLAFLTAFLQSAVWLVYRLFCLRSYRKPNCATPRLNFYNQFDCPCNIHQIAHFCNKNKSIISKIIFSTLFFIFDIPN